MPEEEHVQIHPIPLRLSNAYLIQAGQQSLLVDAGSPGDSSRILATLANIGVQKLDWIILTHAHFDHVGSAAQLRRVTNARVLIQEQDVPSLLNGKSELGEVRGRGRLSAWLLPLAERLFPVEPIEPDAVFSDRFHLPDLNITITTIHTPGHTLGSSILLVNESHLFAGDLVSTTGAAHPQRYYAQDWSALERSLHFIQELRPAKTFPGHGAKPIHLEALLQLSI